MVFSEHVYNHWTVSIAEMGLFSKNILVRRLIESEYIRDFLRLYMRIIYDLDEMTETARGWLAGGSVGLIPVTSNLHAGHLALVRSSLQYCELSVVSILGHSLQVDSDEALTRIP